MKRLFPHPVLEPEAVDYKDGSFDMMVEKNKPQYTLDNYILVPVSFKLESSFIKKLLREKKAKIDVIIKCAKTYERQIMGCELTTSQLELSSWNYADKIKLQPRITATEDIKPFRSDEHHEEFADTEINVPAGAILALGSETELVLDSLRKLESMIRIVTSSKLEDWQYRIETADNYVQIYMNSKTHNAVGALRTDRKLLYPSIFMTVLVHMLQTVDESSDKKWQIAVREALASRKIKIDDELREKAYIHAQNLLNSPVRYMVEDDEND